ncbi:hypothetical protein CBM2637_B100082 [Cupriavidus taiwanensis]|nr:hypothetical protein CBM2637_B100082 [Cupriavidus taiwanensis]
MNEQLVLMQEEGGNVMMRTPIRSAALVTMDAMHGDLVVDMLMERRTYFRHRAPRIRGDHEHNPRNHTAVRDAWHLEDLSRGQGTGRYLVLGLSRRGAYAAGGERSGKILTDESPVRRLCRGRG